jgi:hypothetical protein
MTSSRVPTSAALLLGLVLAAPMAFADQKDDTYKRGMDAVNKGDSIAARDAFCSLPKDYSDAAAQCTTYTDAANRTLTRYKINFSDGNDLIAAGKLDEAAIKFRTIKAGDYVEQAKAKLIEIDRLKKQQADANAAAQQNAQAEQASKAKLDQGNNAFNSGDFNTAKSVLQQVTGSHQSEAQSVLGKIKAYENAITQGNAFSVAKDYNSAKNAYAEALRINPSGPGNPADLMAKAAVAANAPSSTPTNTAVNKPPVSKPQIDVATYLADAQKAIAKKDYKKARRYLADIFTQDRNNQDAKDILADVNSKDTGVAQASDEDGLLLDIVKTYYAGSYQDAEDRLKVYIYNNQGKKKGLANFYLGASMLTRYYLAGGTDQNLKREAQNKFKAAKDIDGFKAPDKFVSPKIMKAFEEAS